MKLSNSLIFLVSLLSAANAIAVPNGDPDGVSNLFKRKGGGGGGGRGSSGSSSGSKSSSSGSSSSKGSGVTPSFGGGKFYGGGSTVPYKAGGRTPSGLLPLAIIGGGLLFWSGLWLAGAYMYSYTHHYAFHNYTSDPERNETLPVYCICQPYSECGCDDSEDQSWLDDIVGNGSYAALDNSLVFVGEVNGTKAIYVNGTLPNGTMETAGINAGVHLAGMLNAVGFWPVALAVGAAVFL